MDCVVEYEAASIVEVVVLVVSLFARTAPRPSGRTLIAPGKSRPLTWNGNRADYHRSGSYIRVHVSVKCQRLSQLTLMINFTIPCEAYKIADIGWQLLSIQYRKDECFRSLYTLIPRLKLARRMLGWKLGGWTDAERTDVG